MHPPFYTVDHKIGPDIYHHSDTKQITRRSGPERLRLPPASTGWPPIPLLPSPLDDPLAIQAPTGVLIAQRPRLQIVPPPRRTLREVVGRMLIRMGQRMILTNRPG